jgi:hypothetical protein
MPVMHKWKDKVRKSIPRKHRSTSSDNSHQKYMARKHSSSSSSSSEIYFETDLFSLVVIS